MAAVQPSAELSLIMEHNSILFPKEYLMKKFAHNFLLCGTIGWCTEIIFTSLQSLRDRDLRLRGVTSLWMFPIYGLCSLLILPYKLLKNFSFFIRGTVYTICIFVGEFFSGRLLSRIHACPWNYERARLNVKKVIRLDYAPLWFCFGLFLEKILKR